MVNTWDDKNDELDECIENSKANDVQLSRNTDGSAAISFTNEDAPRATARYSASSVRAARTVCLFVSFFGLGKCAAIFGPTLIELACHTSTKLENMSYVFTSRSVGYLVGSIIGGWLYDKYNGHGVLALSCVWSTVMMIVLPYATSLVGLLIVSALLGIGLGAIDTCGNVLLLNVWGEKSPPYMQALHFLFALGSFIAPLIAKPFLQENIVPTNNCVNTNSSQCASNNSIGDSSNNLCFSNSSGNTFPVTWAFWICAFPLAITGIGFLVFVFIKSCSLQDTKTNNEDAPKTKQGSLMYRVTFLSLFSVFLLIYVGLEEAYGGYIFAFGSTSSLKMSKDGAALLNSGFWGSFALARLAAVPISKYLPPSKMLCLDLAGCLLGSAVLISQIKDGDCSAADSTKLWVGTVIFGVSTSSVFPAGISWAENFVTVSGRTASLFLVTSSTGGMLIPLSVGSTIGDTVGPCSLMICALVISVLMIVVFLSILAAARYFKRKGSFAGMLFQPSKSKREELRDGQPDEVLQRLDKNNDECDKEVAI